MGYVHTGVHVCLTDILSCIPADVLQELEGSLGSKEAQALKAASAWCMANRPSCLADIQVEPQLSEFLAALSREKLAEKKLRVELVVAGSRIPADVLQALQELDLGREELQNAAAWC